MQAVAAGQRLRVVGGDGDGQAHVQPPGGESGLTQGVTERRFGADFGDGAAHRSPHRGEMLRALRRQHQLPAGAQHPPRFGQGTRRVGQVGQHAHQQRGVETVVRKEQGFGVSRRHPQTGPGVHAHRPPGVTAPRQNP